MKVAIIDYGMGNVASVQKAFTHLKCDSVITNKKDEIESATHIVLPGVGSFKQGMDNLKNSGLNNLLYECVIERKKSFLGICLGMQLLAVRGTEPSLCDGLGWIKGEVCKIQETSLMIPHLGWNQIEVKKNRILASFNEKDFYFIHSYHFKTTEEEDVIARVTYGNTYVAAIQKLNILAVQFHPEKSQKNGIDLLQNFISSNA